MYSVASIERGNQQVIHIDLVLLLILCPTIPKPTRRVIIHITIPEVLPPGVCERLHGVQGVTWDGAVNASAVGIEKISHTWP